MAVLSKKFGSTGSVGGIVRRGAWSSIVTLWMNCLAGGCAQRARGDVKAKVLGPRFEGFATHSRQRNCRMLRDSGAAELNGVTGEVVRRVSTKTHVM